MAPRVFISYSHDSLEHADRVLELSERLRAEGLDSEIDQYEEAPAEGWPRWMQNQVERSDFVLVVCTARYAERFLGRGPAGAGKGAKWEGAIITQELYEAEANNSRFVPVLFVPDDVAHVPGPLRQTTRYDLSSAGGYEALYRRLTAQPKVARGRVGSLRPMPARERRSSLPGAAPVAASVAAPAVSAEPAAPELPPQAIASLLEAADLLSRKHALQPLLEQILGLAGGLIRAEAGSVILLDPDRDDLYFAAASGPKRDEVLPLRLPRGAGKAGKVFQTGEALLENVVVGHYEAVDRSTRYTTQSMVCVPLEIGAERFGVMQMLNKAAGREAFGVGDLALLTRFASHAAVAIERARLFEQLVGSAGLYALPEERRDLIEAITRPGQIALRERMSIFSADMRGFTRLSQQLARPERIQEMLGQYVAMLAEQVIAHRGIVNKVVGDGVLAIFRGTGCAARAVEAGFGVLAGFDRLAADWRERSSVSLGYLDLGVGIATDEDSILGTIGNARFRDFSLVGPGVLVATGLAKLGRGDARLRVDRATWAEARSSVTATAEGPESFRFEGDEEPGGPSYEVFRLRRT